jgi:hypothetical protein
MTVTRKIGRRTPTGVLGAASGPASTRRSDLAEQRYLLDSFPSIFAPQPESETILYDSGQVELASTPSATYAEGNLAVVASTAVAITEIQGIPGPSSNSIGANLEKTQQSCRPVEPDWHSLRQRCVLCGNDRFGEFRPWQSPRWVMASGWVICRSCYSMRREPEEDLSDRGPRGWVLPNDFFERKLRVSPRGRSGVFVDCSPSGIMKGPCRDIFSECFRFDELQEMPSRQALDITCYSCVETAVDVEWVFRILLYHLAQNGVLRLNFLLSPFLSQPAPVQPWLEARELEVRHLPSRRGVTGLFDRLGLESLVRRRTLHVFIPPGTDPPEYIHGSLLSPWNLAKVAGATLASAINLGFGEELTVSRKDASPSAELLLNPRRRFGKVI